MFIWTRLLWDASCRRMWLIVLALGMLVDVTISFKCGEGYCECDRQIDSIDCSNKNLHRFPDDFDNLTKSYTESIDLQGNDIMRMELSLIEWTSLEYIELKGNANLDCKWLDRQDWKILVNSSCELTIDEDWQKDWMDRKKSPDDKKDSNDDNREDYDDLYYGDYYYDDYDDNGHRRKKERKSSNTGVIIAVAVICLVSLIAIVFGILYFMKRRQSSGQRRHLSNILSAADMSE